MTADPQIERRAGSARAPRRMDRGLAPLDVLAGVPDCLGAFHRMPAAVARASTMRAGSPGPACPRKPKRNGEDTSILFLNMPYAPHRSQPARFARSDGWEQAQSILTGSLPGSIALCSQPPGRTLRDAHRCMARDGHAQAQPPTGERERGPLPPCPPVNALVERRRQTRTRRRSFRSGAARLPRFTGHTGNKGRGRAPSPASSLITALKH
jgi:hypothetical protein